MGVILPVWSFTASATSGSTARLTGEGRIFAISQVEMSVVAVCLRPVAVFKSQGQSGAAAAAIGHEEIGRPSDIVSVVYRG